jgi:hypothetical protein
MHGTNIAFRSAGRFACRLPSRWFCQPPDQSFQTRRDVASSERDPALVTAFRSPTATASCEAPAAGSKFPACYFTPPPVDFPTRSALLLRGRFRFAPVPARLTASGPLQFSRLALSTVFPASTPLQGCCPLGIKVSTGSAAARPACRIRPIPFAPHEPVLLLVLARGSSFLVRYFSGSLLFLKPLHSPKPQLHLAAPSVFSGLAAPRVASPG